MGVYPLLIPLISFKDARTADIYHGENSKAARTISKKLWERINNKLDMLNAAISLNDLKSPGNQLEKLGGDLEGYWSIRVNDQYRIVFKFEEGNFSEVYCEDTHS